MASLLDRARRVLARPLPGLSVNVSPAERLATAAAGLALVGTGLARRNRGGAAAAALGTGLLARAGTGHCPAYAAIGKHDTDGVAGSVVTATEAMTINRPRAEVFDAWRRLDTLPKAMQHLESVEDLGKGRSRWTAKGPAGVGTLSWIAEETDVEAPDTLAWKTVEGDVDHAGRVTFADAPQGGTEVRVEWTYLLPTGTGAASGFLTPALEKMLRNDLNRFRSLIEAGEVPTIEGQPKGEWQAGRPVVFPTSPV